jgi:hypothetical protein
MDTMTLVKRRPTRVVVFLLLFLVGGAVVNIAVAWGIAIVTGGGRPSATGHNEMSMDDTQAFWLRHAPADWRDAELLEGVGLGFRGRGRAHVLVIAELASPPQLVGVSHSDAGWPLLSLGFRAQHVVRQGVENMDVQGGWRVHLPRFKDRTLPLLPIWPGFAINTMFYALVLWLLFAAPFALRRWRRTRRGQCPKCGYPAGTSDVCTECGARLPSPSR